MQAVWGSADEVFSAFTGQTMTKNQSIRWMIKAKYSMKSSRERESPARQGWNVRRAKVN
jgi:hypothetical protein